MAITLDGNTIEANDGDNLLESLLSNGADVHYGCRAGACGACRLYDQGNCESILSCQTSVIPTMSLTTQAPFTFVAFTLLTKNTLNDSNIELTLLGPSDDSFGDRVTLCFSMEGKEVFCECMALNPAGVPLTVMVQSLSLSSLAWQQVQSLVENDKVQVSSVQGARKGRLLYEMGLSGIPTLVVSSADNGVFEPYWREVLEEIFNQKVECFKLASGNSCHPLQDSEFATFLSDVADELGTSLNIIYHGQNLPKRDWEQALRPFKIRTTQLHFVR